MFHGKNVIQCHDKNVIFERTINLTAGISEFDIECVLNVVVNLQLLWYSIVVEAMTMTGRPMADERIQLHTLTILAFRGVLKSRALIGWQTAM